MRRLALVLAAVFLVATGVAQWYDRHPPPARNPDLAADLAALRLQATDLQRSVETLARSPDPDPAALATLAERLAALNRSLAQIEGQAGE